MKTINIQRSGTLSVHAQLTEQLKYHIETGTWRPGRKLPPVRQLARALRINYNTVRAAYQELERQGYILSEQGRGTFVAANPPQLPRDQQASLLDLIDEALIKAQALGVPAKEFARIAYTRANLYAPAETDIRLLFTECNTADMAYHANTIQKGTGVVPQLFLLDELRKRDPTFFDQFDLLVTTLFHVTELQEIVGPARKVVGLMVEPSYLDVSAAIGRLPAGSHVGLVCASQEGAEQMEQAVRGVGANAPQFYTAGIDNPQRLQALFQQAEEIFVSRIALAQHQGAWPAPKPVHEYVDTIDSAALRLLRREIGRIRAASQFR